MSLCLWFIRYAKYDGSKYTYGSRGTDAANGTKTHGGRYFHGPTATAKFDTTTANAAGAGCHAATDDPTSTT